MKDKHSIQLPHFNRDKEYVTTRRSKEKKPRFTMIGNKMKSIEIIADFGKPEAFTFKLLQANRNWDDNVTYFSTKELTNTEKVVFSKGYKMLNAKNLLTRIKKGAESIYMFNPNFIIPNEYDKALSKWTNLLI